MVDTRGHDCEATKWLRQSRKTIKNSDLQNFSLPCFVNCYAIFGIVSWIEKPTRCHSRGALLRGYHPVIASSRRLCGNPDNNKNATHFTGLLRRIIPIAIINAVV
ncbi:MAG TPA: hypothetical protein LFV92_07515 [Rickettsia endosymbiont of Ceroptres masudai]|nr:hypothetical protein [Rickettsia endosymbiont of Ceroptres masudai]